MTTATGSDTCSSINGTKLTDTCWGSNHYLIWQILSNSNNSNLHLPMNMISYWTYSIKSCSSCCVGSTLPNSLSIFLTKEVYFLFLSHLSEEASEKKGMLQFYTRSLSWEWGRQNLCFPCTNQLFLYTNTTNYLLFMSEYQKKYLYLVDST